MYILGACYFGTDDGPVMVGLGCLSAEKASIGEAVAIPGVHGVRHQQTWLTIPGFVGTESAHFISRLFPAADRSGRVGYWGAAIVLPQDVIQSVGLYIGYQKVNELAAVGAKACWDRETGYFDFIDARKYISSHVQTASVSFSFRPKHQQAPYWIGIAKNWKDYASWWDILDVRVDQEMFGDVINYPAVLTDEPLNPCKMSMPEDVLSKWSRTYAAEKHVDVLAEEEDPRSQESALEDDNAKLRHLYQDIKSELSRKVDGLIAAQAELRKAQETLEHKEKELLSSKDEITRLKEELKQYETRPKGSELASIPTEENRTSVISSKKKSVIFWGFELSLLLLEWLVLILCTLVAFNVLNSHFQVASSLVGLLPS